MVTTHRLLLLTVVPLAAITCAPLPRTEPDRAAVDVREEGPSWIWLESAPADQEVLFRRTFELPSRPGRVELAGTCDNHMVVLLNDERVGEHHRWEAVASRDVSHVLVPGENTIFVRARNDGGPAGLALRLASDDGWTLVTDGSWQAATPLYAEHDLWSEATVIGPVGGEGLPWSHEVTLAGFEGPGVELSAEEPGAPQAPRPAEALALLEGFEADLLYTVPNEVQGSWVALTRDDRGRLYASDQGGRGIFRITPAEIGRSDAVTTVERVPVDVSGAQGMCWAFGALYANVTGQGVWRVTDTDGDDRLDAAEHLIALEGAGEHGPHAVLPTADGRGLYFVGGNHTEPPAADGSRAPADWAEDLLLPRQWDARGHARDVLAPGGWIARCDPDGGNVEIVSNGYRNQYDIALRDGELFTYDADMEWDLGTPWYRPTRVCHVTSGSEFGWRSGTGKWPPYYEDSLPSVVDLGPGSPTGIVFGAGARFPARYQRALYLLDWTFGTVYAVHLEPAGASYTGTTEEFAWAKPFAVTDAVVGSDGALYLTVGGRGSRSALYRIRYVGSESTAPIESNVADAGAAVRARRRALEAYHGRVDPEALDAAWPELSSPDRFLRFAARIAVENQPVETWRERALSEADPQAAVVALIALARQGDADDLPGVVAALGRLDLAALDEPQRLAALRAYALAFTRLGAPDDALREQVIAELDPLLPSSSDAVDTELVRVLTYLRAPTVVEKTLALMRDDAPTALPDWAELIERNDRYGGPIAKMLADMPPTRNIGYALLLRNVTEGWTLAQRKEYFEFFARAAQHPGGASYEGFLENIREEAAATMTVADRHTLAPVLGQSLVASPPDDVTPPVGPGRAWTRDAAARAVGEPLVGRSFAAGRNLYYAASCSACHRFDGEGGAIGPDLTTVASRFSVADILEAIVEPNKVISDQYGSQIVIDREGRMAEGIVVENGDEVTVYARDLDTPPRTFARADIAEIRTSTLSQMPTGLVDGLNEEELRDLVAYLVSGGDEESEVFRAPSGAN